MQWLELILSLEAGADFALASSNFVYIARFARESRDAARRAGAACLALINGGLALEAALYLWQEPSTDTSFTDGAAMAVARSSLVLSAGLVTLLIWCNGDSWRR